MAKCAKKGVETDHTHNYGNFLLKLLSAQDVNFHFVQHFHFLQGLMREIIIFGARKLFFEGVELSLNFLFYFLKIIE